MYMTGFADEASGDLDVQIRATKALGWENIESRNIDGKNIHDMPEADFEVACGKLADAGVKINCFGSAIANWGQAITDPFEVTLEQIERTIPRMHKLGSKLIRMMSYAVLKEDGQVVDDQMEEERFKRVREIYRIFTGEGITPVHENCMNYGGMSWKHSLKLIENVPGLKLAFDTGNPVFTDDRTKEPPYPKQSALEFYQHVKEHVAYVHIKDARFVADNPGAVFPKAEFTFPGEGAGDVRDIMKDLIANGYDGGVSIEPHMTVVFHEDEGPSRAEVAIKNYVEYGRRMMTLIEEVS
jgi:sugar phosphate isomerase/epimerase